MALQVWAVQSLDSTMEVAGHKPTVLGSQWSDGILLSQAALLLSNSGDCPCSLLPHMGPILFPVLISSKVGLFTSPRCGTLPRWWSWKARESCLAIDGVRGEDPWLPRRSVEEDWHNGLLQINNSTLSISQPPAKHLTTKAVHYMSHPLNWTVQKTKILKCIPYSLSMPNHENQLWNLTVQTKFPIVFFAL